MKKVLVTGSNGSLGKALARLSAKGYFAFDFVFTNSMDMNLLDRKSLINKVNDLKPEYFLHLAARSGAASLNLEKPVEMFEDNLQMTLNVMAAAQKAEVEKVILVSSTAAYPSKRDLPAIESIMHSGEPNKKDYPYAYAKRLMDPIAQMYREQYGMKVSVQVVNGIVGPYMKFKQGETLMLASLIRRFLEVKELGIGNRYLVYGDGKPLREYTDALDLAKILLQMLEIQDLPELINIGNNESYSVEQFARMICDSLDIDRELIEFSETGLGSYPTYNQLTDNSLLRETLNFKYTPIGDSIEETIRWFRENYTWAIE